MNRMKKGNRNATRLIVNAVKRDNVARFFIFIFWLKILSATVSQLSVFGQIFAYKKLAGIPLPAYIMVA